MHLHELFDADWNSYERKRFFNDDPKTITDAFDPEQDCPHPGHHMRLVVEKPRVC